MRLVDCSVLIVLVIAVLVDISTKKEDKDYDALNC